MSTLSLITTASLPIPQISTPKPLFLRRRDLLLMSTAAAATPHPPAMAAIMVDGAVKRVVARPRKRRSKEEDEVLVIDGIEFDSSFPAKLDVFVAGELAGSLVNVPHGKGKGKTSLRIALSDLLEDLGAEEDDSVVVTLVPNTLVTVTDIGIQFIMC